jgi:hypothetical protein
LSVVDATAITPRISPSTMIGTPTIARTPHARLTAAISPVASP